MRRVRSGCLFFIPKSRYVKFVDNSFLGFKFFKFGGHDSVTSQTRVKSPWFMFNGSMVKTISLPVPTKSLTVGVSNKALCLTTLHSDKRSASFVVELHTNYKENKFIIPNPYLIMF